MRCGSADLFGVALVFLSLFELRRSILAHGANAGMARRCPSVVA